MGLANEKGVALVELALCIFLLLLLVFGITEFGRALYIKNALTNAAREGARWAAASGNGTLTADDIGLKVLAALPTNIRMDPAIKVTAPGLPAELIAKVTPIHVVATMNPFTPVVPLPFIGSDGNVVTVVLTGEATMIFE